jgi:large subunit ribosomal protein L3
LVEKSADFGIFSENRKNIPCTVIEAGPCVVTQVRTIGVDELRALQLVSMTKRETFHKKHALGHFKKKAGTVAKKKSR